MNDTPRAKPARQVTIALTASALPAALEQVLRCLSESPDSELRAVYIEDSDLLKAAALPFTVEWCTATQVHRAIDAQSLETEFGREAVAARDRCKRLAVATGYRWHFEVRRASGRNAWFELRRGGDLIVVPRAPGRAAGRQRSGDAVCAIIDDSADSTRVCTIARHIADAQAVQLVIYSVADTVDERILPPAAEVYHAAPEDIVSIVGRTKSLVTIIANTLVERIPPSARDLVDVAGAPLLILN